MSLVGSIKFTSNLERVTAEIERELIRRAFDAANLVRNEWLEVLSGNRSGRVYRVPGTRRTYTASAPGEPPAVQFGDLRRSIHARPAKLEGGVIVAEVGSSLEKALWLEMGTRKIKPRPHGSVAWNRAEPRVRELLAQPLEGL
jgi:hypothetical protein